MNNKKLAIGVLVIAVAALALGGSVYAFFSDTEKSSGNSFTAGTLNLTLNGVDHYAVAGFAVANAYPGEVKTANYTVANVGTIDGTLTIAPNILTDVQGTDPNLATSHAQLSQIITVTIGVDTNGNGVFDGTEAKYTHLLNGFSYSYGALAHGGAPVTLMVQYTIPGPTTGNNIEGASCSFDMVFTLNQ